MTFAAPSQARARSTAPAQEAPPQAPGRADGSWPTAEGPERGEAPAAAPPRFPVGTSLGLILVILGPALVAGVAGAWAIGGGAEAGIGAACWGVCVIAAVAALGPLWLASGRGLGAMAGATLVSMATRLVVAGAGAGLLVAGGFPLRDAALWTGGWYLLMLIAEVLVVRRYLAQAAASGGAGSPRAPALAPRPASPRSPQL